MRELDPQGSPVVEGDFLIESPGIRGRTTARATRTAVTRSDIPLDANIARAIAVQGGTVRSVLLFDQLDVVAEEPTRPTRAGASPGRSILAGLPRPGPQEVHALLSVDEADGERVLQWVFPESPPKSRRATRAGERDVFVVPVLRAPAPKGRARRGIGGWIAKKAIAWVVLPVARRLTGAAARKLASEWEAKHRPYRVRTFLDQDYRDVKGRDLTKQEWQALAEDRALLVIHGTLDRASSSFGSLPKDLVTAFHASYGGRVFAFDHPTLSVTPAENATWLAKELVQRLPPGSHLELDLLCSSRGGLVGRTIAERPDTLPLDGRTIDVRRVVLAAVPNNGTPLVDQRHMKEFLNVYTNFLQFLPDNLVTDGLDVIVFVLKEVATAALHGLPGLQAMRRGGDFLADLNRPNGKYGKYAALASDYEPGNDGFGRWAQDFVLDKVFGSAANDLVVPTSSVTEENGSPAFPIAETLTIASQHHVTHGAYFRYKPACTLLRKTLSVS